MPNALAAPRASRLALVDIDGVLADTRHSDEHAIARRWGDYFSLMHLDGVWRQGFDLVECIEMCEFELAYLTGRREDTRDTTKDWLRRHRFPKATLLMRPIPDRRPLADLKASIVREAAGRYPQGVRLWDDDPYVIDAVNRTLPGAGRRCTWYIKPQSIAKRANV